MRVTTHHHLVSWACDLRDRGIDTSRLQPPRIVDENQVRNVLRQISDHLRRAVGAAAVSDNDCRTRHPVARDHERADARLYLRSLVERWKNHDDVRRLKCV